MEETRKLNFLLYYSIAGFLSGVWLRSFVAVGIYFSVFLITTAFGILLFAALAQRERGKSLPIFLSSVFLFSVVLGITRYDMADAYQSDALRSHLGRAGVFEGIISEEPDLREKSMLLTVNITRADKSSVDETILVRAPLGETFSYGDSLVLVGTLAVPQNFETDTGRTFNYQTYLAKSGIYYEMQNPRISLRAHGEGSKLKGTLFAIKNSFMEKITHVISPPESSLLGGLLLGAKQSLPKDVQEYLRRAGVIHIIVLSGYNITIVARFIMFLFGFVMIRYRLLIGGASIILFSMMVGGGATVVRAAVMALIALLATFLRRDYSITRALLIAGFLMVFVNPKILVFDLSFQLSFLATVGLIYVSPIIEKYFSFVPARFGIREIVVATLATQIFVLPFLIYQMGNFSTVALLVNLLVLPFIPITMLLGFVTGLLGLISSSLATIPAFISYYLLHFELSVARYFGNLPFALYVVPQFNLAILFVSYISLITLVFLKLDKFNYK